MTNVLDTKTFSNIEEIMFKEFSSFPWYYAPNILAEDNYFQLVHNFCTNDEVSSPFYGDFLSLLKVLNPKRLLRMRANLLPRTPTQEQHGFHTDDVLTKKDPDFKKCRTALFYLTTTNGPTYFKKGPTIKCEKNSLVDFHCSLPHASSSCTDKKVRAVINLNYIPQDE